MTSGRVAVLVCAHIAAGGLSSSGMKVQTSGARVSLGAHDIWNGVYSEAQADRGKKVYESHCVTCHGEHLEGTADGPSIVGEAFKRNWETLSVGRLYIRIRDRMPPSDPLSVGPVDKLDAMTHILRANGFPSGSAELKPDVNALAQIQIVGKDGPSPIPTGAVVQAIGCLTQTAPRIWVLTNSTEPARTTMDPLTEAEQKALEASPLGARTVALVDIFPSPDANKGHKVAARGLLIRLGNDVKVNVLSLRSVASTCP